MSNLPTPVLPVTITKQPQLVLPANYSTNGYPSGAFLPTATKPTVVGNYAANGNATGSSTGCFEFNRTDSFVPNNLLFIPFGVGSNGATFNFTLIGWCSVQANKPPAGSSVEEWLPVPLAEFVATLNTSIPGVAGCDIPATNFFCDTITLVANSGNPNVDDSIVAPQNGRIGHVMLDDKGFGLIQIVFTTLGSATSCNGLLRGL
jgi:hypothetical protein